MRSRIDSRRKLSRALKALTLALVLASFAGASYGDDDDDDAITEPALAKFQGYIPRMRTVAPGLLCGGQPEKGGLAMLKKQGVKTIINLRDSRRSAEKEQQEARSLGLNFVHIPLGHRGKITDDAISKFLAVVDNRDMQPVYVHCNAGKDRTAAMIGIYRLERDGWTASKSYEEMRSQGFHTGFKDLAQSVFDRAAKLGRPEPVPVVDD
jgi:protein tyrosine/serine phosphatase